MNEVTQAAFADELEKISGIDPARLSRVRREGEYSEGLGKTMRGAGYGGGALALGASFLPGIRSRALARRLLRTGAAAGGLAGYFGEQGIRVGRGYQRAADVAEGLKKAPVSPELGLDLSPSAYGSAYRYLQG